MRLVLRQPFRPAARRVAWPLAVLVAATLQITSVRADDWRYAVQPGDSIWNVTARFLDARVSYRKLQRLNRVRQPLRLAPGTILTVPLEWMRRVDDEARVQTVHGRVEIESSDHTVRAARPGETLRLLDRIRTDADGHVALSLSGGTEVRVLANSELILDVLARYANAQVFDQRLQLVRGRTETSAPRDRDRASRFELRTRAGITSVRGTIFRVATLPAADTTSTEVLRGTVSAANDTGNVAVDAGFGTRMSAGQPPLPPTPLLPAPVLDAIPEALVGMPVRIDFAPVANAVAYRVQVAASDNFAPLLADIRTDAPQVDLAGLDTGDHAIRVRAIDPFDVEGLDALRHVRIDARPSAPKATVPAADALVDETPPEFRWQTTAGDTPLTWRFQLARDAAFTDVVVDRRDLADTALKLAEPLAPGLWHWHAGATHAKNGDGLFSATRRLRRTSPQPSAAQVDRTPDALKISWERAAGALPVRMRLAAVDAPDAVIAEHVVVDATVRVPRPAPGRYRITGQTVEADGFVGPDSTIQDLVLPPPPSATAVAVETSAEPVADLRPALRWQPVDETAMYRVQIARTPDFASPIAEGTTGTATKFVPDAPLAPGRHFWRIAVDSPTDGAGPFGPAHTLLVVPPAPGITSVTAERNGIAAAWTAATGTASFEAQLATTADFAKPVATQRTSSTGARFERPASGDYFVRVRGLDDEGRAGPYSNPATVRIASRFPWWVGPFLLFPLL